MRRFVAVVVLAGAFGCAPSPEAKQSAAAPKAPAPVAWHDPSPHTVRHVTVAPGITLEVLDWGGSGTPVVFLSGLGNTAHIFDGFAPQFADSFHVVGITRRGFGASSQPDSGYDIATRVSDLLAALDSLKLGRVDLVGHSIAGDELTGFAARHPDRVRRLVYLDAAYDHRTGSGAERPPFPTMTAADSASPQAMLAFSTLLGQPVPEGELRATVVFDSIGHAVKDVTGGNVYGAILKGLEAPPYEKVKAPVLAFYAQYDSPEGALSLGWWQRLTPEQRAQAQRAMDAMASWSRKERERFHRAVPGATIVALKGANHFVWFTNGSEVAAELRRFLKAK